MSNSEKANTLLDPSFLRRLEQLELATKKIFRGRMKGERLSKRKGQSVEFADYRNYVVGDDLRFLDWNLYARLDRLFLRLFMEEEDLHVFLLIDNSLSMSFGAPTKLHYACQIAAALGFVGLIQSDRVKVDVFNSKLAAELPPLRGRQSLWRLLEFLENQQPEGTSNVSHALRTFSLKTRGQGIVVVMSDFMDKGGYQEGLRYLLSSPRDVYVLQILSQEEIEPDLDGDVKMIDVEDEDEAEITVSPALIHRYKQNLNAYRNELRKFCAARGMTYLFASNQESPEKLVLSQFRRRGLLRS